MKPAVPFFLLLACCLSPARAGDPILGVAQGVAIFEACSRLSPELAQRYRQWLERRDRDWPEIVKQAKNLEGYDNLARYVDASFAKHPDEEMRRECHLEFDREMRNAR